MEVTLFINNRSKTLNIHPGETLLETLRGNGYPGTKFGCGSGDCGSCIVLLNDEPVNSCQVLTAAIDGEHVTTIEGVGTMSDPHPVQQALVEAGAVQCGYCTPGMVLSAIALLKRNPIPSDDDIKTAISGNLCRCTGYVKIIEGIKNAAKEIVKTKTQG